MTPANGELDELRAGARRTYCSAAANGGAPGQIQGSCESGELDAYFAAVPAELPVDGGETSGAPLPVRTVPTT